MLKLGCTLHIVLNENSLRITTYFYSLNSKVIRKKYFAEELNLFHKLWTSNQIYNLNFKCIRFTPSGLDIWVSGKYSIPVRANIWQLRVSELNFFFLCVSYLSGLNICCFLSVHYLYRLYITAYSIFTSSSWLLTASSRSLLSLWFI